MASFFLLGGAIFLDMLPWTIRVLLLIGALAPLAGVRVRGRGRYDASSAYPYPSPQNTFGGFQSVDDDPYGDSW